jgi:hypothetical protein
METNWILMEIFVNLMGCSWNVMEMNVMLMRIDGISKSDFMGFTGGVMGY